MGGRLFVFILFFLIKCYKNDVSKVISGNFQLLECSATSLLSAAERRGTPVLLSVSVSDNSGNSPQIAAPRRSCKIDQSTQRFHVGCDNRCLLGNKYNGLHGYDTLNCNLLMRAK